MLNLDSIARLYENVLLRDSVGNRISISDVRAGIQSMGHVYAPDTSNFESTVVKFPNFNDPACRCAYLHKYAPLHTYFVQDAMLKILEMKPFLFQKLVNLSSFKFCSLGGGPGSDVIGVLGALYCVFGSFDSSITVVDCMEKWEETFKSIMRELSVGSFYSEIWSNIADDCQWNYVGCNLLSPMTNEVNKSIASASFISMIKFVSAVLCTNTEEMVDKIFRVVKPGALVLFIDNAAGGFTQLIERSSNRNGLVPVFGPLRHVPYEAEALKIDRFGYTSCYKTKVTIILLQKSHNAQQIRNYGNNIPSYHNENLVPKPLSSLDFVVMGNNTSNACKTNINNNATSHSSAGHSSNVKNILIPTSNNLNVNSNSAVNQKQVGVSKINHNPPNLLGYPSSIAKSPTKVDNLKSNLQKPNAAAGQKTRDVAAAHSKSPHSSGVSASQATRTNMNRSLRKDNSNAAFGQTKSNIGSSRSSQVSPKPVGYTSHPLSDSYVQSTNVRNVQPTTSQGTGYRPVRTGETENAAEDVCCSCCVVS